MIEIYTENLTKLKVCVFFGLQNGTNQTTLIHGICIGGVECLYIS
jgi:hypothetical protein